MPVFGRKSTAVLASCDKRLQKIMNMVIEYYDFSAISGHREREEKKSLFDKGFSKLKYPYSKHNVFPSKAVDIAPYPIDWKDTRRFDILAGHIMMAANYLEIKIRWGGDWDSDDDLKDQKFNDVGHFEVVD